MKEDAFTSNNFLKGNSKQDDIGKTTEPQKFNTGKKTKFQRTNWKIPSTRVQTTRKY
jgi:hypothetical protein